MIDSTFVGNFVGNFVEPARDTSPAAGFDEGTDEGSRTQTKPCLQLKLTQISNLKSQISNLKSQISNFKFQIPTMIRLRNVSKTFAIGDGLTVVRDVNLDIARTEYVGILGASGSGKSTLLYMMGLLDRPSSGTLHFAGRDVTTLSDDALAELRGRSIGFVFQAFHLIGQLSVLENVELPLFYQHVLGRKRRARAMDCLERVHLANRADHLPAQLSGGECQRTAIARALITEPALILADEPTGNLDSQTGRSILCTFEELHAQGTTLVLITHDPAVAERIPRIVRIADGAIVEETNT